MTISHLSALSMSSLISMVSEEAQALGFKIYDRGGRPFVVVADPESGDRRKLFLIPIALALRNVAR